MEFEKELKNRVKHIEEILQKYLPKSEGLQKTVMDAMNYSVLAGGKRLRPMIMEETFLMTGGTGAIIEPFMAALEFIHNYSLVHDDLPAMDNDEYRRGRKTTHAVYGEAMGILAGDALLNYAFETASKAFDYCTNEKQYKQCARSMQILAKKAGIYGMLGGQVVDVESEGKEIPIGTIEYIHHLKTAALIECAMMIGATLAGTEEDVVEAFEKIGSNIGLAFQIQDDVLDVCSTTEILGKPVGSDEENHKYTYVNLKGVEVSKETVKSLTEEAVEIYEKLPYENPYLKTLLISLIDREK